MKSPVLAGIGSAALFVAFLVALTAGVASLSQAPAIVTPVATTTQKLEKRPAIATSTASALVATTTPKKKTPGAVAAPAPSPAPSAPVKLLATQAELNAAAAKLEDAIVNILCAPKTANSSLHAISGSGVFITSSGIILTDAHIGQYLLLEHNVPQQDLYTCVVRTGNPAEVAYYADVVDVSSVWVGQNSQVITELAPLGTGEHDVALLGVTKSATRSPLPSSFPYVPVARTAPDTGDQVIIASYAAQFLDASDISSALSPTVVYTNIKNVYTFASSTVDIVSLGGSIAAQEGSSGGGVVNPHGELIALVTTSTVSGDLTKRELRALSAPYVRKEIATDTSSDFDTYIAGDVASLITAYTPSANALAKILVAQLNQ